MQEISSDQDSKLYFGARQQTIERLSKMYGEHYFDDPELAKKRQVMYDQELTRMGKWIDMEAGGKVLDVGCGPGNFLAKFDHRWEKYGFEVSPWARKQAESRGIITEFVPSDNYFDLVVFRGTWQHVPNPVSRIEDCYYWLKKGGAIVFLATPNHNSLYYKWFGHKYTAVNFLVPTDQMLAQVLKNFGFMVLGFEYPYLGTPYARPVADAIALFGKVCGLTHRDVPTFGKVMECYALK